MEIKELQITEKGDLIANVEGIIVTIPKTKLIPIIEEKYMNTIHILNNKIEEKDFITRFVNLFMDTITNEKYNREKYFSEPINIEEVENEMLLLLDRYNSNKITKEELRISISQLEFETYGDNMDNEVILFSNIYNTILLDEDEFDKFLSQELTIYDKDKIVYIEWTLNVLGLN